MFADNIFVNIVVIERMRPTRYYCGYQQRMVLKLKTMARLMLLTFMTIIGNEPLY